MNLNGTKNVVLCDEHVCANKVVLNNKEKFKTVYIAVLDHRSTPTTTRNETFQIYINLRKILYFYEHTQEINITICILIILLQFYETGIDGKIFLQERKHNNTYIQNTIESKKPHKNVFIFFWNQNLKKLFSNVSIVLILMHDFFTFFQQHHAFIITESYVRFILFLSFKKIIYY